MVETHERLYRAIQFGFVLLAAAVCSSQSNGEEIKIGGTGTGLATMRLLADAFAKTGADATFTVLPSIGSSGGIKAVAAGAIQLAVSSRDLSDAERQQGLKAVEFGRTPFVFAVSVKNKTAGLTMQQVVEAYSARTVQWPDGVKIRLVLRPPSDGDSEMVRKMSPAMLEAKTQAEARPGMLIAITDQETQDNIEALPGALGGTSLGQILAEHRQIKALALDGVQPSPQSIADGSYPYVKIMFLVASPKTSPMAQRFAEFVRSPAGREILQRTGYWVL